MIAFAAAARRARTFASLVKLSHSVFALPFALSSLLVATDGAPSARLLGLVVLAVVAARTAAMGSGWIVSLARSRTSTLRCEYRPASSSPPGEASGSASATMRAKSPPFRSTARVPSPTTRRAMPRSGRSESQT